MRTLVTGLSVLVASAGVRGALAAQRAPETAGFLWRLGSDTTEVERFTIALEPQGTRGEGGGVLKMAWDRTSVSVEIGQK